MGKKQLIDWIPTSEAARICGVSPQWIRRLIKRGIFKRCKREGHMLFLDRDEVTIYYRSNYTIYGAKGEKIMLKKGRRIKADAGNKEFRKAILTGNADAREAEGATE